MEVILLVILVHDFFVSKAVGVKGLGVELSAKEHQTRLLYPGNVVHVFNVKLCGAKFVSVPSAVASTVVEGCLVFFTKHAERKIFR